jgi:hypothetical protein
MICIEQRPAVGRGFIRYRFLEFILETGGLGDMGTGRLGDWGM